MRFHAFLFILGAATFLPPAHGAQLAASRLRGKVQASHVNGIRTNLSISASSALPAQLLAAVQQAASEPNLLQSLLSPAEADSLQKQLGALSLALSDTGAAEEATHRNVGVDGGFFSGPGGNILASSLGLDLDKLSVESLGPTFLIVLIICIVSAIIFEAVHYRFAEADLSLELEYGNEKKESQLMRLFAGIRPIISPYFFNPESKCSWNYVAALLFLGLIDLAFGLIFMLWSKEFWDSLEKKKSEKYMRLMIIWLMLVPAWVILGTYTQYISMMMTIHWRKFLTDFLLQRWLRAKIYYRLQLGDIGGGALDNPDQRLQEDVPNFVKSSLMLGGGLMSVLGQFITMLPVLLLLSPDYAFGVFYCPGWLLYMALAYSGIGTLAAHLIGNKLILINFALQKYEANFRYYIVQVRDHAESIALYGSEDVERMKINERFDWLIRCWWMLMKYAKRLGFFTSFYMVSSHSFPYLVLAPSYFKGDISLGTMFMLFSALRMVKDAFDWLIHSYGLLTDYRATVDRLKNFWDAIDAAPEKCSSVERLGEPFDEGKGALVAARNVCVHLPGKDERKLWENAGLIVKPGQFILLSAPEGSGKSCFFRALAGIWPYATGDVFIDERSLFLPQRSFVPQGTLKQAVAYPEKAEMYTDEEVKNALKLVKLDVVEDRELSDDANWEMALSGGEQQRLAIAHAVLNRPQVLFLDEATSNLSDEGTMEIYNLLRQPGILQENAAVISISHDLNNLEAVHDVHFRYDPGTSSWTEAKKS